MACRLGACEINNNRTKSKKAAPKKKAPVRRYSSSDWSDFEDSCSGCSDCCGSSSICSCSECNFETDSSDSCCYASACGPKARKPAKKQTKTSAKKKKEPKVCEWISVAKRAQNKTKAKKAASKGAKTKKASSAGGKTKKKTSRSYDCC